MTLLADEMTLTLSLSDIRQLMRDAYAHGAMDWEENPTDEGWLHRRDREVAMLVRLLIKRREAGHV